MFHNHIAQLAILLFYVGLPVKILKVLLPSILATWPAHLNLLDLIILSILGEQYKLWFFSLWSLLHTPFSSVLSSNFHLRILFSNTFSVYSSLNVTCRWQGRLSFFELPFLLFILFILSVVNDISSNIHISTLLCPWWITSPLYSMWSFLTVCVFIVIYFNFSKPLHWFISSSK